MGVGNRNQHKRMRARAAQANRRWPKHIRRISSTQPERWPSLFLDFQRANNWCFKSSSWKYSRRDSLDRRCHFEARKKRYRDAADWYRLFLAEIYLQIIEGNEKPPIMVLLKNIPVLLDVTLTASRKIPELTSV